VDLTNASVTWLVIAVAIGFAQGVSTLVLPQVEPGMELEQVVT